MFKKHFFFLTAVHCIMMAGGGFLLAQTFNPGRAIIDPEDLAARGIFAEPIVEDVPDYNWLEETPEDTLLIAQDDLEDTDQSADLADTQNNLLESDEAALLSEDMVADAEDVVTDDQQAEQEIVEEPVTVEPIAPLDLVYNKKVQNFITMYTGRKKKVFTTGLSRYGRYMPTMQRIFAEQGLPKELAFLSIVESNLNPKAVSRANAVGIWQFMRYTGQLYGLEANIYYDERLNVEKATLAAAQHLRDLYQTFNSWELALAAYNAGPGRVRRAIRLNKRLKKSTDYWNLRLPRETRGYVPAFHAVGWILKDLTRYGFEEIDPEKLSNEIHEFETRKIEVPPAVSFAQIQKKLGINQSVLKALNPEIKHEITPPTKDKIALLIPHHHDFDENSLQDLKSERVKLLIKHKVVRGDNLIAIAKKYGTSVSKLRRLNPKVRSRYLRVGSRLIVAVDPSKQKFSSN